MHYEKTDVAVWSFSRFSVQHERPRPRGILRPRARAYVK